MTTNLRDELALLKSQPLISDQIGAPGNQISASLFLGMAADINDPKYQVMFNFDKCLYS